MRGFPWIQTLGAGFQRIYLCKRCAPEGRSIRYARGTVEAFLDVKKGVDWPDVIGCGHFPFFILSERALSAFLAHGVREFSKPRSCHSTATSQKTGGVYLQCDIFGLTVKRFREQCWILRRVGSLTFSSVLNATPELTTSVRHSIGNILAFIHMLFVLAHGPA